MPRPKEHLTQLKVSLPQSAKSTIDGFAIELGCIYHRDEKDLPGHRQLFELLAVAMADEKRREKLKKLLQQ